MSSQHVRPKWWQVYLTLPLLAVLFAVDSRLRISTRGHQAVQIGIVLLVYGLIHWWLKANSRALSRLQQGQHYETIRVIRIPTYPLPESKAEQHPLFQIPESEIKGMLSDTFEMDIIDAEFLPSEVPQELNKE